MPRRRQFLLSLLVALMPLPGRAAPAADRGGVRLVDGWVLTDRDIAALARLDR
jgi:hypothetical protein